MYVPCGKCYGCRLEKRQAWCFRLFQELRDRPMAFFCTFTYDDQHVPNKLYDVKHLDRYKTDNYNVLSKDDASQLIKDLQTNLRSLIHSKSALVRYYLIGEYGDKCDITHGTNRPHYHAILYFPKGVSKHIAQTVINRSWHYGFIDIANVTFADINYVAKHQFKESRGNDYQRRNAPIFAKMSRYKGGLGSCYLPYLQMLHPNRLSKLHVLLNGYKLAVPQFYRKKLFPDKMTPEEMTNFMIDNNAKWHREFAAAFGISCPVSPLDRDQADSGSILYEEFRRVGITMSNIRWRKYAQKKFSRLYVKNKIKQRRNNSEYVRYIQSKKTSKEYLFAVS